MALKKFVCLFVCWASLGAHANGGGTSVQTNEYTKKSLELRNFEGKIKEAEKQISELVEAKEKASTPEAKHQAIQSMVKVHEQLQTHIRDYNKLRLEVKYKYPGKGAELEGRYHQREEKSLDEMERSSALDVQLTKTKKAMEKKFAPIVGKTVQSAPTAEAPSAPPEEPEHYHLER